MVDEATAVGGMLASGCPGVRPMVAGVRPKVPGVAPIKNNNIKQR